MEKKDRNICIAMSAKDREKIAKLAHKQEMSVSAFIRLCIRRELERWNVETQTKVKE